MRAVVYERYGPPEVLRLKEVATPVPTANEILIKVWATTVNRTDCGFRSAEYVISRLFSGLFKPKNKILGNEFAGEVIATGELVTQFKTGDRVFGYNDKTFGAHAEYMVIAETAPVALIPSHLSYAEAAPLTEGAHYALCDIRAAKLQAGQHVLINGATGAIGSAAVQLAKHFGARVVAVCETKHVDLIRSLGADEVIDYHQQDFTQLDQTFDFVFDAVGKSAFGKCKPILKSKGIYISTELGKRWENVFLALISPFSKGKKVLFPIPSMTKEDALFLEELARNGSLKPLIDRTYPLEETAEAHRYAESGMKTGNLIILPQQQ